MLLMLQFFQTLALRFQLGPSPDHLLALPKLASYLLESLLSRVKLQINLLKLVELLDNSHFQPIL